MKKPSKFPTLLYVTNDGCDGVYAWSDPKDAVDDKEKITVAIYKYDGMAEVVSTTQVTRNK